MLYGNAWQGDYLCYATDFGILEGHGIAVVAADGSTELFLDSATEADRAEAEVPGTTIRFAPDIVRGVGARLEHVAHHRLAAAPRRFLPSWLADRNRGFALEDATALLDRLLMHKLPAEIAVLRRAAQLACAFVAGAATALSPCVLPVLPAVLGAGVTGGRRRPLGVVTGLVFAFTFATIALVYVIDALGLPDDLVRTLAIVTLFVFGISLLIPVSATGSRPSAAGSRPARPGSVATASVRAFCWAPASGSSTRPAPGRSSPA